MGEFFFGCKVDDKLNDIINHIYMSAADPAAWSQTLKKISELFGNSKIAISHQNFIEQDLSWAYLHDYDVESVRLHYEEFNTPERNVGLRALLAATPLEPFTISSFLTPEEFYGNDSIRISLITQNIHHGLFNVVDKEGANTSLLAYRGRKQGDFTANEADMMRALGSHVRNAVRLARCNILMSLRQAHQDQITGEHRYGTLLMSTNGNVVDADGYAQHVLETNDAISARNGKLQVREPCAVSGGDLITFASRAPDLASYIIRDTAQSFVVLKKLPRPYIDTALFLPSAFVALAIRRVEVADININTPAQIFGLTDAEISVGELVCLGLTQDEIADRLQVSRNTVKTHLRSIFAKTDTRRQSELVVKLLKLAD